MNFSLKPSTDIKINTISYASKEILTIVHPFKASDRKNSINVLAEGLKVNGNLHGLCYLSYKENKERATPSPDDFRAIGMV